VEAIGYRFNPDTLGIEPAHHDIRQHPVANSTRELVQHKRNIIQVTTCCVEGRDIVRSDLDGPGVLEAISQLHHAIAQRDEPALGAVRSPGDRSPFLLINGPLADALTHIGQLNTYKRVIGIESPASGYMDGKAP
jgi:hypothetical protein